MQKGVLWWRRAKPSDSKVPIQFIMKDFGGGVLEDFVIDKYQNGIIIICSTLVKEGEQSEPSFTKVPNLNNAYIMYRM